MSGWLTTSLSSPPLPPIKPPRATPSIPNCITQSSLFSLCFPQKSQFSLFSSVNFAGRVIQRDKEKKMLMRSASARIPKSLVANDPCASPEAIYRRSASVPLSSNSPFSDPTKKKIVRTSSEGDIGKIPRAKLKFSSPTTTLFGKKENTQQKIGSDPGNMDIGMGLELGLGSRTMSLHSWLFPDGPTATSNEDCSVLIGEGGVGGGGGDVYSGSGSGSNHGFESTDRYYQKMIKANPGNALLLGNYAKFLKEVSGDLGKSEEYCTRAILANANDGNVFSMYGALIWDVHKDSARANTYFDQAVQAAPDDCYVLASYARFLWDVEEEEKDQNQHETGIKTVTQTKFTQGLAAALPPAYIATS